MGRKTFISVVDKEGKEVFKPEDNVVKGKNITTDFIYDCISDYISDETKKVSDSCIIWGNNCIIWYNIKGCDYEEFKKVLKNIRSEEYKEYSKLEKEYDALIKCRLNTTTLKDFNDFTIAINEQEKVLKEVEEPAHKVIDILEECEKFISSKYFESESTVKRDYLFSQKEWDENINTYFIKIKVSD